MKVLPSFDWYPCDAHSPKWWGGLESPEEVAITAVLVQQTRWENVRKAYENLRVARLNRFVAIKKSSLCSIKSCIKSVGMYASKSKRLKELADAVIKAGGWKTFINRDAREIRTELLRLNGIGYETADSILLFAGNHLIFPASRLIARVLERIGFNVPKGYEAFRRFVELGLPRDLFSYKLFYASSLVTTKVACHSSEPECQKCYLSNICRTFAYKQASNIL
ncbi:MAG: endonuclease III domain-containing protein [Nitrososphaerota archaeon]